MNKKEFKTGLIIVVVLFITMLLISGGTLAYLQWQTSTEQLTALNVSVSDNINMTIDPASVTKTGMRPTNNCAGDFAMVGTSTVTITNNTGTLARPRFKLKIKITDKDGNNITDETSPAGQKYMYYVKYAVTEYNGNCTRPIIAERFSGTKETSTGSGWYDSPTLTLGGEDGFPDLYTSVSFDASANAVTQHAYQVWIWIDSNYTTVNAGDTVTNDKLQDATITVSWSENSTVEQVRDCYAYSCEAGDTLNGTFCIHEETVLADEQTYQASVVANCSCPNGGYYMDNGKCMVENFDQETGETISQGTYSASCNCGDYEHVITLNNGMCEIYYEYFECSSGSLRGNYCVLSSSSYEATKTYSEELCGAIE